MFVMSWYRLRKKKGDKMKQLVQWSRGKQSSVNYVQIYIFISEEMRLFSAWAPCSCAWRWWAFRTVSIKPPCKELEVLKGPYKWQWPSMFAVCPPSVRHHTLLFYMGAGYWTQALTKHFTPQALSPSLWNSVMYSLAHFNRQLRDVSRGAKWEKLTSTVNE